MICLRSGFRSWTFLFKRFSERVPKDKSVDDLSMKIFIGITTNTLRLVMSYHLQKCFLGGQTGTLGSVEEFFAVS